MRAAESVPVGSLPGEQSEGRLASASGSTMTTALPRPMDLGCRHAALVAEGVGFEDDDRGPGADAAGEGGDPGVVGGGATRATAGLAAADVPVRDVVGHQDRQLPRVRGGADISAGGGAYGATPVAEPAGGGCLGDGCLDGCGTSVAGVRGNPLHGTGVGVGVEAVGHADRASGRVGRADVPTCRTVSAAARRAARARGSRNRVRARLRMGVHPPVVGGPGVWKRFRF